MSRITALADLIRNNSECDVKTDYGKEFDELLNSKPVKKDTIFIVYTAVSPVRFLEDNSTINEYNFTLFVRTNRDIEESTDELIDILSSNSVNCEQGNFSIALNSVTFSHEENFTLTTINLTLTKGF